MAGFKEYHRVRRARPRRAGAAGRGHGRGGARGGDRAGRGAESGAQRGRHQGLRPGAGRRRARHDRAAPLAGVPFLLKDLGGAQAGVPMSAGSRFFAHAVAPVDAEIVVRHKRAGLMILGRTNTPEFGLSATTEPVVFGPTRNPWDLARTPGGSSGGSAAAVAARMVPVAHASDGGGSIRIPASCCGLFGLKTTRDRNTYAPYAGEGLAGCAVEHVVSRSVRDSAAVLDATAGPGVGDPYFAAAARAAVPRGGRGGARAGCGSRSPPRPSTACRCIPTASPPRSRPRRLCEELGHRGRGGRARLRRRRARPQLQPHLRGQCRRQHLRCARARSAASRTPDGLRAGDLGDGRAGARRSARRTTSRCSTGCTASAARSRAFFETYDVLLTPTLAEPPVELGVLDMMSEDLAAYSERLWRFTPFTYPFNVTGQPAMSVPLAWNGAGLPIGVHFVGRYGDEATPVPARRASSSRRGPGPTAARPSPRVIASPGGLPPSSAGRGCCCWRRSLAAISLAGCARAAIRRSCRATRPRGRRWSGSRPARSTTSPAGPIRATRSRARRPTTGSRPLELPSVGENGQPGNLVTARYYEGKRSGAKPLVIVLPIWGIHDYPSNDHLGRPAESAAPATINVLQILGERPLFDWQAIGGADERGRVLRPRSIGWSTASSPP